MRDDARARPRNDGRPPEGGPSCRPSDRARQLPRFWRSEAYIALTLLIAGLALPGCQSTAEAPAENAQSAGYPPLQTVPPRPQLSYTVQQQRQIVEALVADREHARYTDQVIRYRSGLSSLPPPPGPPPAAGPIEPAAEPSAKPEPALTEQETLADFLRALRRQIQSDPEPAPTPAAPPAPSAENTGAAPMPPARSAVAARLAQRPDPVGQLLDDTVAQAPLPPDQSAVTARLAATDQLRAAAPVPAPRPATLLAPPPVKPILPVSAPAGRRPADGDRAAGPQATAKATS